MRTQRNFFREAPVRLRFGVERFERFRFQRSRRFLCRKGFFFAVFRYSYNRKGRFCFRSVSFLGCNIVLRNQEIGGSPPTKSPLCLTTRAIITGKDGSVSGFGSWKTVRAVPVPLKFRFQEKRFRRFRFPVPVRFLSHPAFCESSEGVRLPREEG